MGGKRCGILDEGMNSSEECIMFSRGTWVGVPEREHQDMELRLDSLCFGARKDGVSQL